MTNVSAGNMAARHFWFSYFLGFVFLPLVLVIGLLMPSIGYKKEVEYLELEPISMVFLLAAVLAIPAFLGASFRLFFMWLLFSWCLKQPSRQVALLRGMTGTFLVFLLMLVVLLAPTFWSGPPSSVPWQYSSVPQQFMKLTNSIGFFGLPWLISSLWFSWRLLDQGYLAQPEISEQRP